MARSELVRRFHDAVEARDHAALTTLLRGLDVTLREKLDRNGRTFLSDDEREEARFCVGPSRLLDPSTEIWDGRATGTVEITFVSDRRYPDDPVYTRLYLVQRESGTPEGASASETLAELGIA